MSRMMIHIVVAKSLVLQSSLSFFPHIKQMDFFLLIEN